MSGTPFGGGGSTPAGTTTSTQTTVPWSVQQPYLAQAFGQAQNLFQNNTPQYFPQSTVAGFSPLQTQAQAQEQAIGTNGTAAVNSAGGYLTDQLNGNFLSAGNPYFQQMAQSTLAQTVPQLEAQFGQGGGMTNPNVAYGVSNGANNAIGSLAYQNYSQGLQNMNMAAMLAPGQQSSQLQQTAALNDAGAAQQQQSQAQLNDAIARFNFSQALPYNQLNAFEGAIQGNYGGTSTLTQPYFQNNSGALGLLGLAGGSGLSSLLGGSGSGSSGSSGGSSALSTILPIAGMAAMMMMSDRRLKNTDGYYGGALEKLRKMKVYNARYKGEPANGNRPMLMADEVARAQPQSVVPNAGGPGGMFAAIKPFELIPMLVQGMHELDDKISRKRAA